jgi:hypothetical protein
MKKDNGKYLLLYNRLGIPEYTFYAYGKGMNYIYNHNY